MPPGTTAQGVHGSTKAVQQKTLTRSVIKCCRKTLVQAYVAFSSLSEHTLSVEARGCPAEVEAESTTRSNRPLSRNSIAAPRSSVKVACSHSSQYTRHSIQRPYPYGLDISDIHRMRYQLRGISSPESDHEFLRLEGQSCFCNILQFQLLAQAQSGATSPASGVQAFPIQPSIF